MLFSGVAAGICQPCFTALYRHAERQSQGSTGEKPFDQLIDDHRQILSLLDNMLEVPDSSPARKARLYMMLKRRLAKHALAEEDVVYPLVRNDSANGDERRHLYDEHADMKILAPSNR